MEKHKRVAALLEYLNVEGEKAVSALANHFLVTEATIRRDLKELEIQGRITRSHGMAKVFDGFGGRKIPDSTPEQRRLARRCTESLQSGHVVLLPGGTVNEVIATNLSEKPRITVITNSPTIFDIVKQQPQTQLISLGGIYSHTGDCIYGHITETTLRELRADVMFFEPSGIDMEYGFTHDNIVEIPTIKIMMRTARSITLAVRSAVVVKTSGAVVDRVEAVSAIITTSRSLIDSYRETGENQEIELFFIDDASEENS
jgi:DeoR family transcriptional regulator, fructose operon transcriptional repressor